MLQQRFEYDPYKRFVLLKVPLNSTFYCTIEISKSARNGEVDITTDGHQDETIVSPEFPCRCVKESPNKFSITLVGVDNSGFLKKVAEGERGCCFRFCYRLSSTELTGDDGEYFFVPLNNKVRFSYSYGTEKEFGMGAGHNDIKLIYMFPAGNTDGRIVSSWISSVFPWKVTWSMSSARSLISSLIDKTRNVLLLK